MQSHFRNKKYNQKSSVELELELLMASLSLNHQVKKDMQNFQHEAHSETDVWRLCKMLQLLLSDEKLYQINSLKKLLKASKNGWIPIEQILSIQSLQPVFQEIQLFKMISKKLLTKYIDNHFTISKSFLKTNKKLIKRRVPFKDKLKNVKHILIQNFPKDQEMQTLKQTLKDISQVYKIKWNIIIQQAYVYVEKPQEVLEFFNSQHTFQIQNASQNQQNIKIEAYTYEEFINRVNLFKQIQQRQLLRFLRRTFLRYMIKNGVEQKAQNFHQENDMIRIIQDHQLFNPQIINRYQQQNNQIREDQTYVALDPRFEQMELDQQAHGGYEDPRFEPYYSRRRKNRGQINRKINNIMKDIKTFCLPNLIFNEKFLKNIESKSNNLSKVENDQLYSKSCVQQKQSIIDSLLQQKFTSVIEI